ncbi:Protein with signal anchor [Caenorhabditis elegans]|uniref:Protein with signal anchor n=1 Tax=Caenorhabditis elegans TaxID=6239 RepID=Q7YXH0_CAEEL|nr:Protein with signal anchor [Caenorhabditis elegans]CCD67661.1 Protein with signal anchor [Caenorhabditis elegans]|eukprot:NP_501478.2 Uncharacterized protein CELE_F42A9.9 [Caenorhabditis elegans]
MTIRERKHRWVRRARILMAIELALSVIFDLTMIGAVKKGQMLNCLLIVVITINLMTGARLFLKLRGIKCASSIMAYVLWKIVQEVVMVPALVVFSFICVDKYLRSWTNANRGVQILLIVWTYAIYSLFLIIFLGWLARFLWQLQVSNSSNDKNENGTTISFIDGFHSEADHQELLLDTVTTTSAVSNEALELRELPRESNSHRPFVPYDHVVPYISN